MKQLFLSWNIYITFFTGFRWNAWIYGELMLYI